MTEKATTGHSLGDRHRKGGEHHDPGCDPGALAGGISLKLRGQPVRYHLSSLSSGLVVLPPASPTCSLCRNHKVVPWDKEETGEIQILLFGGGGAFHLILPTVTRRKPTLIVLPAGFLLY